MQGKLFLVDTTSPKSLTSISSLPHLHICCSFSLLENPASSLKQNQSLTVIHEGAEHKETVETWNPPIIIFILTKFPSVFMHLK